MLPPRRRSTNEKNALADGRAAEPCRSADRIPHYQFYAPAASGAGGRPEIAQSEAPRMLISNKISQYNRKRKWDIFIRYFDIKPETRFLDVGFSDFEWDISENFIEKHYPYPEMLTALGKDKPVEFTKRYPKIKVIQYSGGVFPFQDQKFDICWSNAVLEHVGGRDQQILFLREIKRVSKIAFITTPNRLFPIETHTQTPLLHYLPKKTFDLYLNAVGKKWASGEYLHLLKLSDLRNLLKLADIVPNKIIRNKFAGLTLDFVIIF